MVEASTAWHHAVPAVSPPGAGWGPPAHLSRLGFRVQGGRCPHVCPVAGTTHGQCRWGCCHHISPTQRCVPCLQTASSRPQSQWCQLLRASCTRPTSAGVSPQAAAAAAAALQALSLPCEHCCCSLAALPLMLSRMGSPSACDHLSMGSTPFIPSPPTPAATGAVVGISIAILVLLFAAQSLGTQKVSAAFSPLMLIWFAANAIIGVVSPSIATRGWVVEPNVGVAWQPPLSSAWWASGLGAVSQGSQHSCRGGELLLLWIMWVGDAKPPPGTAICAVAQPVLVLYLPACRSARPPTPPSRQRKSRSRWRSWEWANGW